MKSLEYNLSTNSFQFTHRSERGVFSSPGSALWGLMCAAYIVISPIHSKFLTTTNTENSARRLWAAPVTLAARAGTNTHQRVNFLLDACASGVASALRFQEAGASCCQADEHGAAHARGVEVLLLVSRIFSGNSASSMQRFESPLQSTSPPAALRRGFFISGGPEDDGHGAYLRPPGGLGWVPRGEQAACLSRPSKGN